MERAARALQRLIDGKSFATRVGEVREAMQAEDGVNSACDAIEELLAQQGYYELLPSS